jgi:hypothetical protein
VGVAATVTPDEALELVRQGEGQKVEFKKSFAEERRAIESLCAFINADGGTVFFGVSPDGSISGAAIGANRLDRFSNNLRAATDPPLSPIIDRLALEEKEVVVVAVPRHAPGELFYAFNVPLVRVGATNQVMTPAEQRARLTEPQEERSEQGDRPDSAVARPLAGPESQGLDALASGRTVARNHDKTRLRTIVTATRRFFGEKWPSRIDDLNRDSVGRQVQRDEVYEVCLPHVQDFARDVQLVEAFGLALVEAEYGDGLVEMLRIVQSWISMSDKVWPGRSLRPVTGAPALLALRVMATWGAKAADQMSASLLATLLTHPLDTMDASGEPATLPLADRRDMFWPRAMLDRADVAVRYLKEEPWNNTDVTRMFASQQDYLDGLSLFLFLAALLYEARHAAQWPPLYPGFKLVQGSWSALRAFVSKLSTDLRLAEAIANMASEDVGTFKARWPERANRLNEASVGGAVHPLFSWGRIPGQI